MNFKYSVIKNGSKQLNAGLSLKESGVKNNTSLDLIYAKPPATGGAGNAGVGDVPIDVIQPIKKIRSKKGKK